jgi:hypothetical protein
VPLVATHSAGGWLALAMFVFGAGMGLANSAMIIGVQASVGWEQRGVVTALTLFARTMGGALGVGALGAVLAARLDGTVDPEVVQRLLDPHGPPLAVPPTVIDALANAIDPLFWAGAVCGLLALGVAAAYPPPAAGALPATPGPIAG